MIDRSNQLAKAIIDIAAADLEQADPEKDGQRDDATAQARKTFK